MSTQHQSSPDDKLRPDDKATETGRIGLTPLSAAIKLTLFTGSEDAILTKQYAVDGNGAITRQNQPLFSSGTAETVSIERLSDIEQLIDRLGTNQCMSTGVFESNKTKIVRDGDLTPELRNQGFRSRSKKYMAQPDVGLTLLDHDIGLDTPEQLRCDSPERLMALLCEAVPQLASVAYSGAGSCSSGIRITATGTAYQGGGGLHLYITIQGVDLEKLRRYLVVHLWINGLGYIAFARNGAMLERTIIDPTVLSPERLIYEANPVLGAGLARRARQWQHRDGIPLSGDFDLTSDEIAQYERLTAAAKADPENRKKAEALADRYHEARVDALAKLRSISREEAEKLILKQTPTERESREQSLQPDDVVEIQGRRLTIAELLAHGSEYDNLAMPDPVEGAAYGLTTAKFFYNNGISPCIHSFAHGLSTVYRLRNLERRGGTTGGNDYLPSGTHSGFDIDRAEPLDRRWDGHRPPLNRHRGAIVEL